MPMWRCPHCGTPQAETARCWVCHRSSTACATCRNFRRSVAAQLGYCGLDRQRRPLQGSEIRACWEAAEVPIEVDGPAPSRHLTPTVDAIDERTPVRRLEFVEVVTTAKPRVPVRRARRPDVPVALAADASVEEIDGGVPVAVDPTRAEPRWNLWGDLDR